MMEPCKRWKAMLTLLLVIPCFLEISADVSAEISVDGMENVDENSVDDYTGEITWMDVETNHTNYYPSLMEEEYLYHVSFTLAEYFLNLIQPNDVPYELIRAFMDLRYSLNMTIDFTEFQAENTDTKFSEYEMGFMICVTLGVVYIITLPIVGLLFCCCRCCGRCGGKMVQSYSNMAGCFQVTYGISLFLITTMMALGGVSLFMISENASNINDKIGRFSKTTRNLAIYQNNTAQELNFLTDDQFNFVISSLNEDVDNLDGVLARLIEARIQDALSPVSSNIDLLKDELEMTILLLTGLESDGNDLSSDILELDGLLAQVKRDIARAKSTCGPDCDAVIDPNYITININSTELPTMREIIDDLQLIEESLENSLTNVINAYADIYTEILDQNDAILPDLKDAVKLFNKSFDTIQDEMFDVDEFVMPYKLDRDNTCETFTCNIFKNLHWYIVLAVSSVVILIVLLNYLGLILGACGHDGNSTPTQRSRVSNCGGLLLMASVGMCFIFASILMMLVTTLFFSAGNLTKMACEPLKNGDIYSEIIDYPYSFPDIGEYMMGGLVLDNASIPLLFTNILSDCQQNRALYPTMMVDTVTDIEGNLEYLQELDNLISNLMMITASLEDVDEFVPDEIVGDFESFETYINEDILPSYENILARALITPDLTSIQASLEQFAYTMDIPDSIMMSVKQSLLNSAADLALISEDQFADARSTLLHMMSAFDALKTIGETVTSQVDGTCDDLVDYNDRITSITDDAITQGIDDYKDRLTGFITQYRDYVLLQLNTTVGQCKPMRDIYDSLLLLVCDDIVYTMNGLWFSLGMCVFLFMPSIILSVKLAKYFRIMNSEEGFDNLSNGDNYAMKRLGFHGYGMWGMESRA